MCGADVGYGGTSGSTQCAVLTEPSGYDRAQCVVLTEERSGMVVPAVVREPRPPTLLSSRHTTCW
eukprot:201514-Rhodomonas_salina.1